KLEGHAVAIAENAAQAVERRDLPSFDAAILSSGGADSVEEMRRLRGAAAGVNLVAIARGEGADALEQEAAMMSAGADDFVRGPVDPSGLSAHVSRIGTQRAERITPASPVRRAGPLVGQSPAILHALDML